MNNQEQLEPIDFLSEDGHSYSIFTLEDHLNEAKTQNNEIIYTCEATSKKIKSEPKFISLEELRKKDNPAQTTIIHNLTIYNNKLTSQIQNLQHELIALKRTKPIIVEKISGLKKN